MSFVNQRRGRRQQRSSRNVAQTVVTNETSKYSICADVLRPRSTENSCCHASQTDLSERGRRLTGTIDVFEIVEASITIRSTSFISGLSINRFRPRLIVPGRWTELCAFFSRRWLASFHVLNRITDRRDRSFGYNNLYSLNMNYVISLPAFVAFSNNDCDYWSLILLSCWKDRGNINLCETVSKGLEECSCSIMKLKFDVNSYTTYNLFTKFFITYNSFPGDKNPPIFRSSSIPLSTRHITSIKGPLESSRSSRWNSFCCHHPTTSPFPRYDGFKDRLNFESSVLSIPVSFSLVPSHSPHSFALSLSILSPPRSLLSLVIPTYPTAHWRAESAFFFSLSPPLFLSRAPTFHYRYYATCVFPRRRSGSRRFRGFRAPFNFPRASRRRISEENGTRYRCGKKCLFFGNVIFWIFRLGRWNNYNRIGVILLVEFFFDNSIQFYWDNYK